MKTMKEIPPYLFTQKRKEYQERIGSAQGRVETIILRVSFFLRKEWKNLTALAVLILSILLLFTLL